MCTCEEIERGTYACKASKLGLVERWWTQDGKLGITIQDPPQSPEDGHIYCIYLFVLHSVTCMLTDRENTQYVLMCILVLKSYSIYESAGMIDLGAHDECIYSVYKSAGMSESD